jgi:glycosyltransferase involved in cell wall biosynthesis
LDPRKNLGVALDAWRALRDEADFVVAGRGSLTEESGLRFLGPVPDEQLPALYSAAAALLLPSFYEGFGLPVLEAMQCGAPVIVSRDRALIEVAGAAALHADAADPVQWRDAMRTVLRDPSPWRAAGLLRAAEFSRERMARKMREVYQQAITIESGR